MSWAAIFSALVGLLTPLIGAINRLGEYWAQKQLLDAGGAQQKVAEQQKVDADVQKAKDAVVVLDDVRTKRLRSRFDQATGNE